jgi:hypothetical protein
VVGWVGGSRGPPRRGCSGPGLSGVPAGRVLETETEPERGYI